MRDSIRMRMLGFGLAAVFVGVGAGSTPALAGFDLSDAVLGEDAGLDFGGWTQFGYTSESTGLFNDRKSVRNNQTWFYIEKAADGSNGLDFGFRVDGMYGGDAGDTQAFGNPGDEWDLRDNFQHGADGFALPQAYLEAASGDWHIMGGHFYTLVGYEVVTAPDNFFYSHAFTMYNSEPFTHTGALVTYSGIENLTLMGGWTAGWDTGFEQNNGGSSFLGGFSWDVNDMLAVTYIATAGNLGAIGDGYSHSIVADAALTDRLNYVFQSDFVTVNEDLHGAGEDYETIGVNNYLTYAMSDMIGLGMRAEWWQAYGEPYFGVTGGVNIMPCDNITLRPEVRWQFNDGANAPGTAENPVGLPVDEGAIFGMDAIFTF